MGITYRSVDLQTVNLRFDIYRGFFEPPEVRGEDDVIPGMPGRDEMAREADRLIIRLEGWVIGTGETRPERQATWYTATRALMAVLDRTLPAGALVLSPEPPPWAAADNVYLGLPGEASISVRCVNLIPADPISNMQAQRWSIDLEAVDGAFWTIEESS